MLKLYVTHFVKHYGYEFNFGVRLKANPNPKLFFFFQIKIIGNGLDQVIDLFNNQQSKIV